MTDLLEDEFMETVAPWLKHHYAPENVEISPKLRRSGRFPDAVVTTPMGDSLAIEVENEHHRIYESVGQAIAYANELTDTRPEDGPFAPVVVLPTPREESESFGYMSDPVEVRYVDPDWSPEGGQPRRESAAAADDQQTQRTRSTHSTRAATDTQDRDSGSPRTAWSSHQSATDRGKRDATTPTSNGSQRNVFLVTARQRR